MYMLQVRFNGAAETVARMAEPDQQAIFAEYAAVGRHPGIVHANQLQRAETAVTVEVADGNTVTRTGVPVDPVSALDGYYVVDAPDLDTAVSLAARIPAARLGGTVEIRPLIER